MMNGLELGMSTLPWYYEPELVANLPLIVEAGIYSIELRRLAPHVDVADRASVRGFTTACRNLGLAVNSVHMPREAIFGMSDLDASVRERAVQEAKGVAEAVAAVGGRILVTHTGGLIGEGIAREQVYEASRESLAKLAPFCAHLGVSIGLENTLPRECGIVDEQVRMCDSLNLPNVGCCLDTSHANLAGGDPVQALRRIGSRLIALHVSDNDGERDMHALPGEGNVDWTAFLHQLEAIGYGGVFTMEVRGSTPRTAPAEIAGLRGSLVLQG